MIIFYTNTIMKEISNYLFKFIKREFLSHDDTLFAKNNIPHNFIRRMLSELQLADKTWKKMRHEIEVSDMSSEFFPNGDSFNHIPAEVRTVIESRRKIGKEYRFSFSSNDKAVPGKYIGTTASVAHLDDSRLFEQNVRVFLVYPFATDDPVESISAKKIETFFTDCLHKIYLWLHLAFKEKPEQCSRELNIYIYFSELFKVLPETKGEPIEQLNANTAFTTSCAPVTTIHIFREEEWFKVFIHECFHCLGFDFSHSTVLSESAQRQVLAVFPVTSEVNLFETYCETFAEIVNVIFYVYLYDSKENFELKIRKIKQYMLYENIFTCFQCAKVLQFYGLSFENLYKKDPESVKMRARYREHTNVLAYYVVKAVYMTHLPTLFQWFSHENHETFVFVQTQANLHAYCDIFRNNYSDPYFISVMKKMEDWFSKHAEEDTLESRTLRMTLIE